MEKLEFGQSVVGLLVDGVADTAYTGATLRMEQPRGVVVEVPYLQHGDTEQFEHVEEWFATQTPPKNMKLETPQGVVCLFDIRWRGHTSSVGVSLGQLAPTETLLGQRTAALEEPLTVTEVHSHVDGLREWTRETGVEMDHEADDEGLATGVLVHVKSGQGEAWQQGEATLYFANEWHTEYPNGNEVGGLNITDASVLVSTFPTPRPFAEHLSEQRKVVHLLVLLAGTPIKFRRHRVADETIVMLTLGGTVASHPRADLISSQTVREYASVKPTKTDLGDFLTHMPDVGAAGMARWAEESEKWRRFVLPAVGVLGRKEAFMEDVIVSLSMSIEAAGQIIGERKGEEQTYSQRGKPITATYVYRVLDFVGVQWSEGGLDNVSLANAVANTYNTIKHFDRGEFPERSTSHIVSVATRYIVRLLTLHILDPEGELLKPWREANALWRVSRLLEVYKVSINKKGHFAALDEAGDNLAAE